VAFTWHPAPVTLGRVWEVATARCVQSHSDHSLDTLVLVTAPKPGLSTGVPSVWCCIMRWVGCHRAKCHLSKSTGRYLCSLRWPFPWNWLQGTNKGNCPEWYKKYYWFPYVGRQQQLPNVFCIWSALCLHLSRFLNCSHSCRWKYKTCSLVPVSTATVITHVFPSLSHASHSMLSSQMKMETTLHSPWAEFCSSYCHWQQWPFVRPKRVGTFSILLKTNKNP
jgi:hypothetical protein